MTPRRQAAEEPPNRDRDRMRDQPEFELLPKEQTASANRAAPSPQSKRRLVLALVVAVVSDVLSAWLEFVPPVQWALDGATALALFAILGRQWALLPAFVAEAIPGVAVFPAWVLVVAGIGVWGQVKPAGPNT